MQKLVALLLLFPTIICHGFETDIFSVEFPGQPSVYRTPVGSYEAVSYQVEAGDPLISYVVTITPFLDEARSFPLMRFLESEVSQSSGQVISSHQLDYDGLQAIVFEAIIPFSGVQAKRHGVYIRLPDEIVIVLTQSLTGEPAKLKDRFERFAGSFRIRGHSALIVSDAEVWLTEMSVRLQRQIRDPDERIRILTQVHYAASRAKISPELVLAVIDVGSNFDTYAISVAGALGLMQVMPYWKNEMGRPDDNLLILDTNLRYGCTILSIYLDEEKGDLRRALGRYNASPGYANEVIDKLKKKWFQ